MANFFWMLIETAGSLLAALCVLRAYTLRLHVSPHNPVGQFTAALTDWLVLPLRKFIPVRRNWDGASLLAAALLALLTAGLYFLVLGRGTLPSPVTLLTVALVWLLRWSIWLAIALLIVQAVLSWVNPYAPLAPVIQQLTTPLLAPVRRLVPLVGGVDLSPLILIVALQALLHLLDWIVAWPFS
jgi:YggT family protein